MSKQTEHRTSNLYEAAFLLSKGFKLTGKERAGAKTILCFVGEGIDSAVLSFYDEGQVNARLYSEAYKKLKDFIFTSH